MFRITKCSSSGSLYQQLYVSSSIYINSWLHFTFMRPCIVTCDRASWHVTVHRDMWPCIVTCDPASWHVTVHRNFICNKTNRCTNFTNLFWLKNEPLQVSGSSSVHHQQFIHCTLGTGICHAGMKRASEQGRPALLGSSLHTCVAYTSAKCTVNELLMMDRRTARNL